MHTRFTPRTTPVKSYVDFCPKSLSQFATYRSMTPPESPLLPLLGASESSSSKKITQGRALWARVNTSRTFCSL